MRTGLIILQNVLVRCPKFALRMCKNEDLYFFPCSGQTIVKITTHTRVASSLCGSIFSDIATVGNPLRVKIGALSDLLGAFDRGESPLLDILHPRLPKVELASVLAYFIIVGICVF